MCKKKRPESMHFQSETKRRKRNGILCGYAIWNAGTGSEYPNRERGQKGILGRNGDRPCGWALCRNWANIRKCLGTAEAKRNTGKVKCLIQFLSQYINFSPISSVKQVTLTHHSDAFRVNSLGET